QHLYLRGSKLAMTQYYYKDQNGTCQGPVTAPGYEFYAIGAEVPASALVQVTIGAPTGTGNITQRFATTTDGLVFPAGEHDTTLGADCYPSSYDAAGASAVCLPDSAYAFYY